MLRLPIFVIGIFRVLPAPAQLQQMLDGPGNGLSDIYFISLDAQGVRGESPSGSN